MQTEREERAATSASRLGLWCAALLAGLIATAAHLPRLERPLEQSLASASTTYMVMFFRNWDEAGFATLKGLPTVGTGGASLVEREPYLHHPVLSYWAMYGARRALGWKESSFRLAPMLATILAAAFTVLLAGRLVAPGLALLAGVLFVVTPLSYAFGMMPNSDPLVVLWLLGGVLLHLDRRAEGRRRGVLYAWFFVGTLIEWQAYFLAPALLLYEVLQPAGQRRLRSVWPLFGIGTLAVLVILVHFAVGLGSAGALVDDVRTTVEETWQGRADHDLAGYLANQAKTWRQYFGWPLIALMAGLLIHAMVRPGGLRRPTGSLLAALAVPGLLAVSLFRTPAYDHDFFWMPLLIMVPTGAVLALRWITTKNVAAGCLAAVLVVASCVMLDFEHEELTDGPLYRDLGALVNRLAGERDLVITPETVAPTMFYTRAHFRAGEGTDPYFMNALLERRREGRLFFDRLYLWMHEASAERHEALIAWAAEAGRELALPGVRAWIIE